MNPRFFRGYYILFQLTLSLFCFPVLISFKIKLDNKHIAIGTINEITNEHKDSKLCMIFVI
jgi:hypothetical protein